MKLIDNINTTTSFELSKLRERYMNAQKRAHECGFKDPCPEYKEDKFIANPATISGYDKRLTNFEKKLKLCYEAFTGDYDSKLNKIKYYDPEIETIDHRGLSALDIKLMQNEFFRLQQVPNSED